VVCARTAVFLVRLSELWLNLDQTGELQQGRRDEALRDAAGNATEVRRDAGRLGEAVPRLRDANLQERPDAVDLAQQAVRLAAWEAADQLVPS